MKINDIIKFLENKYPLENASDFDDNRIGLCIGSYNIDLENILLSLDLTLEVVEEAIATKSNLIISHHPFIYKPITKIFFDSYQGKIIELMCHHQISLYVIHTNLDVGKNGVNDTLANILGLKNIKGIADKDHFLRYGEIKTTNLKNFALEVKEKFQLTGVRVTGDLNQLISRVGIIGGSGGQIEEIDNAIKQECDCYITGEIKLNVAQYALVNRLALIEVNHGVEKYALENTKLELESRLGAKKKVFISKINTDPMMNL